MFIGYWNTSLKDPETGEKKTCEIDFLLDEGLESVPIEVKSVESFSSKSLRLHKKAFPDIQHAVRISLKNFGINGKIWSLPLYATSTVSKFLKEDTMPWN